VSWREAQGWKEQPAEFSLTMASAGQPMEPLAITGIGCLLPGESNDPQTLWDHLLAGHDLITSTPADRWNLDAYYHPDPAVPGRTFLRWGGFVSNPDLFDAGFFAIPPREALRMDPQQRWLLHTAWEALEDAGYAQQHLAGAKVGVYIGISSADYGDIQKRGRFEVDAYTNSGNALSIASNRISYALDLRGPSLSVDTACSSSLVALDLACQAMWRGDIALAIVGGANSLFTPDLTVGFSKAAMLSPDGRCKSFDASANGYVRSEGAACVVLKPLATALADGDRVYAVVRSTYVNQDGRTGGMTVPSIDQQAAMLAEAYRRAGISPLAVGYVEAHGTGTPVGDPIEALALGRVLGECRTAERPLWIGSIKSNLGHLEPASGVAGLAKLALALHRRTIPPNVHFHELNPRIPFGQWHIHVPTQAMPWQPLPGEELLFGGVNSFGFGGTNAHAVLSSVPVQERSCSPSRNGKASGASLSVWTVSARSKEALKEAALRDAEFLQQLACGADMVDGASGLGDYTATVQRRRSHHSHRLAVVAGDAATAGKRLRKWAEAGQCGEGTFAGQAPQAAPAPVLVFSGQGAQWPGMAKDLFEKEPLFRAVIEQFDDLMRPRWGRSLIEMLRRGDESVFQTDLGQPLFFALQVGLARLLEHWGIRPACVLGHSIGEVAAAHVCGALSVEAAAWLAVERSLAQELTRGTGGMAAVGISAEEAEQVLAPHRGHVHIAAVNSPTQLTLAGDVDRIDAVVKELAARAKFARVLALPYAYHTPCMDMVRDRFMESVAGLQAQAGSVPYISTVTGTTVPGDGLDVEYWWHNLRQPVQFLLAVRHALQSGHGLFVEIGPHPALVRYLKEIIDAAGATADAIGTLRRKEDGVLCLRETVAALHVRGVAINWAHLTDGDNRHRAVPRYPWQKQPFWAEAEDARRMRLEGPEHPLLGTRQTGPGVAWQSDVSVASHSYLQDHGLDGRAVFPAAGFLELLLAVVAGAKRDVAIELNDVRFERVLWMDRAFLIQTNWEERGRTATVNVRTTSGGEWHVHCRAKGGLLQQPEAASNPGSVPEDLVPISVGALYERFERAGHLYGPSFRALHWAGTKDGEYWGRLTLPPELHADAARYLLHPALLDAALQLTLSAVPVHEEREAIYLPIAVDRARWLRPSGHEAVCRIHNVHQQDVRWYTDVELYTPDGALIASFERCCCFKKGKSYRLTSSPVSLYREVWVEAPVEAPPGGGEGEAPEWLLLDATGTGRHLAVGLAPATGPTRYWRLGETECNLNQLLGQGSHFVIWAVVAKEEEPLCQHLFDAVWPIAELARALTQQPAARTVVLVTAGASDGTSLVQASLSGLFRVLSTELPKVVCKWIDLDAADPGKHCEQVLNELRSKPQEEENAFRGGQRWSLRLEPQPLDELKRRPLLGKRREGATFHLHSQAPGSLESLAWVEMPEAPSLGKGEVEIAVRAAGLNFRDVLKALDLYPLGPEEPRWFGDECAGEIVRVGPGVTAFQPGDAVVAIAADCLGNRARVHECLVAKKPENLSWAEAATIPIAFLTAEYSLCDLARLQPGETVLVHAAAGGVGQAAVQIARGLGAIVLGTASPEKHDILRANGVSHAFTSRDLSFVAGVRAATAGAGVDVVLNSLAGDFIPKSLDLLKPLGRFVEIGKKDIFQNEWLSLSAFRTAVSFAAVDLARVIADRPAWIGQRLRTLLGKFQSGEYRPLPQMTYPCQQIHEAFRLMAQGKHRGKVVLTCSDASPPEEILAANDSPVRSGATYLITGGLSGFGLATAQWLVEEGAGALVLMGRRGPTAVVEATLESWRGAGVQVRVVGGDVTSLTAVESLLCDIQTSLPPLRGVFHSAMVLQDEPLARLTADAFARVLAPKVQGAWNLHQATRDLPLDFFVLYSSVATLFGSAGQASYVTANRFLETLAEQRGQSGLPALSVNWGPLAEFGVLADNPSLAHYVEAFGLTLLHRAEIFSWLKFLLRRRFTGGSVMQIDWARFAQINPKARASPRFSVVLAGRETKDAAGTMWQKLTAAPPAEHRLLLLGWLRNTLARVLGADEQSLDESTPLLALGLDSLMAFEFKLQIDRELDVAFPVDRLTAETRLAQLPDLLLAQLHTEGGLNGQPVTAAAAAARPAKPGCMHIVEDGFLRLVPQSMAGDLPSATHLDAAALAYLPDKLYTVGGLSDEQMTVLFGQEPFMSHCYETPLGSIGIIMLPVRSNALFSDPQTLDLILRALDLADSLDAKCISLTGLIPSATDYGLAIQKLRRKNGGKQCLLTTGHATTTAAVVHNLQNMLGLAGRSLADEAFAVVGLGSIGQSCLRLLLEVLPHPRNLVLCDLFAKQDVLDSLARTVREEHGYRGMLRILPTQGKVPDEVYEASTILAAVSVPEVLDVARFRSGCILADDSYPPAVNLASAVRRAEEHGDFLFSNVGMLRLPSPTRETVTIPTGSEAVLERFGVAAFRDEVVRDPYELTACVLSSLLTGRHEGFEPTLGLAGVLDLVSHYRSLEALGITAAGLQCETYFVPPELIDRFRSYHDSSAACRS
jgi:acyl transferase domain-containing protein/NADPH:quinone reductase-like Zn-dependent oxidoreductase/acyl carrier protein